MWYSAVGSIVALSLSLLAVPRAAAAPPAGSDEAAQAVGGAPVWDDETVVGCRLFS